MNRQYQFHSYSRSHNLPTSSAYTFPIVPQFDPIQTWSWAPANSATVADALEYANNRCYAFYLVGSGQVQASPHQTHMSVVAPEGFVCPYRFRT